MLTYLFDGGLWAFLGWLEVMVLQINVADDVVVCDCVLARAEVPGLILRVVWPALKSLQLVLEVQDVVRLLVTEGSVLNL